jgi:hypothetical protein
MQMQVMTTIKNNFAGKYIKLKESFILLVHFDI